ncbi:hypothetical protein [Vibrio alginolyticus]|uniref:hypothetical protein n=1 Tax=Vibrio alginolyticus TaxID=663 RepID=UPI0006CA7285|nr:hypothetical protein [Vibrio alginolyticus]KPM97565.1 hypothetical protein AOG25_13935 [Vibrio alginolyticus]
MASEEKEFELTATVTISVHATVKAKSLEEAIAKSVDLEIVHTSCAPDDSKDTWVAHEFDGEPDEIKLDEA